MELWKPIPGYEGLYEASNLGQIRTAEGKTTSNVRYSVRVWKQRVLKQKYELRKSGGKRDARVSLWKDGKDKTLLVARLVAMAWCDGYAEHLTVNHIDGNPLNNTAENLEWISLADNIRYGFDTKQYSSGKSCALINSKGEKTEYPSMSSASRGIGRNDHYIICCLSKGTRIRSSDGEVYGFV